ncbi:MAG: hypothetical protein AB1847_17655 [bacterium]
MEKSIDKRQEAMDKIQRKMIKIAKMVKSPTWIPVRIPTLFIVILVLGVSPGHCGLVSQSTIPAWSSAMDNDISRLSKMLKEQQSEKSRLLKKSDRLAEKIMQEKQKSDNRGNRKLDSLMSESQRLVSDLEALSRQIEEAELQLEQKYSTAISALVNRLEGRLDDRERKTLLKQLLKYLNESERLEKPVEFEVPKVSLELRDNDTSSEIRKKADFLSDQATLLKAKIFQVEAQVTKLEKEKSLRDKVKKFTDGMSFFDDTLLVTERKVANNREPDTAGGDRGGDEPPLSALPPSQGESGMILPGSLEESSSSFILGREAFDSSPADLILSNKSIEKQIELLKIQKSQMASQIQHLLQKTETFYKRAEELSSSERP